MVFYPFSVGVTRLGLKMGFSGRAILPERAPADLEESPLRLYINIQKIYNLDILLTARVPGSKIYAWQAA